MTQCVVNCPSCSVKLRFFPQTNSESTVLLCPECSNQFLARQSVGLLDGLSNDAFNINPSDFAFSPSQTPFASLQSSAVAYTTTPPTLDRPVNVRWILFLVGVSGAVGVCLLISLVAFVGNNVIASSSLPRASPVSSRNSTAGQDIREVRERARKSLEDLQSKTEIAGRNVPQSQPNTPYNSNTKATAPKIEPLPIASPKPKESDFTPSPSRSDIPNVENPPSDFPRLQVGNPPTGGIPFGGRPFPEGLGPRERNMPDRTGSLPPIRNPSFNQPGSPFGPGGPSFTPPDSSLPEFKGPQGVRVYVTDASQLDAKEMGEQLTKGLNVTARTWLASGTSFSIGLRYAGPLSDVVENVSFGEVTEVDEAQRIIRIKAKVP